MSGLELKVTSFSAGSKILLRLNQQETVWREGRPSTLPYFCISRSPGNYAHNPELITVSGLDLFNFQKRDTEKKKKNWWYTTGLANAHIGDPQEGCRASPQPCWSCGSYTNRPTPQLLHYNDLVSTLFH